MVTYITRPSDFTFYLDDYCWRNVVPGILVSCDPMIDLKMYLGQCGLYFMVQRFCMG